MPAHPSPHSGTFCIGVNFCATLTRSLGCNLYVFEYRCSILSLYCTGICSLNGIRNRGQTTEKIHDKLYSCSAVLAYFRNPPKTLPIQRSCATKMRLLHQLPAGIVVFHFFPPLNRNHYQSQF